VAGGYFGNYFCVFFFSGHPVLGSPAKGGVHICTIIFLRWRVGDYSWGVIFRNNSGSWMVMGFDECLFDEPSVVLTYDNMTTYHYTFAHH